MNLVLIQSYLLLSFIDITKPIYLNVSFVIYSRRTNYSYFNDDSLFTTF